MESPPLRASRWILGTLGTAVVSIGMAFFFFVPKPSLVSSPSVVRPWAEDHFLKLTAPVPSKEKATHPQFTARHGGSHPSTNPNDNVTVIVEPAAVEFVPDYEVVEFDAAETFATPSGSGEIRWLAAKPYALQDFDDPQRSVLTAFHPDGRPLDEQDSKAAGITRRDLEAWGLELNGEAGSAVKGFLEIKGFSNLQWKFQDVFDATTQVSVRRASHVYPAAKGLGFSASLAMLHDAPLLAVIDLAHGETQDFEIPIAKGARVNHADFSIEIIDVLVGSVGHGSHEWIKSGGAMQIGFGKDSSGAGKSFSVIYQINPASMETAISVDAINGSGGEIKNHGRFMEHAPVSRFEAPLTDAKSLRIRYRPHQTRLLLKLKSLPGIHGNNLKPIDLFDVTAPEIVITNSFQMRRVIADITQLKDTTGSLSYDTSAAFPMPLKHFSPRQMAEHYLALDSGRSIKVDPAAMTIEFEAPKKKSWVTQAMDWSKRQPWWP